MTGAFLCTGASGVIGRALLRRLWADPAWAGVRFYLTARRAGALEALAAEAAAAGIAAEAWPADLADAAQRRDLVGRALGAGPLLGFAWVAGINHDSALPRLSEGEWDRVWAVNTAGPLALLARLREGGTLAPGARALLVGSQVGLNGNPGQAAYAAAKGALLDLLPLSPPGLRLNVLLPPLVDSPLLAGLSPSAREALFRPRRLADPDPAATCAAAGAFLLSDASRYIHRRVWHADSRVGPLGLA